MSDGIYVYEPGDTQTCGEGCGRKAEIEVAGLVFCSTCIDELVTLGTLLRNAMPDALRAMQRMGVSP